MNYRIAYLLEGKSKRYSNKIIRSVYRKFGVGEVYLEGNPSHITLKYRFDTNNIKKVEDIIQKICDKHKSSFFEIGGVGNFNNNTLHLKVKPSKEMVHFEKDLIKGLDNFKGDLHKWDKLLHKSFHVGLAHHDIEDKFDEIKDFLKKYDRKFKVKFDAIYLIKKLKGKWNVQKKFKLR